MVVGVVEGADGVDETGRLDLFTRHRLRFGDDSLLSNDALLAAIYRPTTAARVTDITDRP